MSKKKNKKKRAKQSNPHKLNESQLKEQIKKKRSKELVNDAYSLVKVLLERFETKENVSLFQSILNQKISYFEALGKSEEVAQLVSEGKKRFSPEIFKEAEEYLSFAGMANDQLLEYFSTQSDIPDLFRYQIADILYFSQEKNRSFIKKHAEFKDVFYVKEAFNQGYDPVNTPKLLAALKESSPYKSWFLLHKSIQAFQEGDMVTLELVKKKLPTNTFSAFLANKLLDCQIFLDGKRSDSQPVTPEDLEIFKTLCGEHCSIVPLLSKIIASGKEGKSHQLLPPLRLLEKKHKQWFPVVLYYALQIELLNNEKRNGKFTIHEFRICIIKLAFK